MLRVNTFKQQYFTDYTVGLQIRHPSIAANGKRVGRGGCVSRQNVSFLLSPILPLLLLLLQFLGKKDHKGFPVPPINLFTQVAEVSLFFVSFHSHLLPQITNTSN
jgi:hypothetical protein